jgi:hypothetical protein
VAENRSAFLSSLKKKDFKEERVAKVGADDLNNSTTLESNKSLLHFLHQFFVLSGQNLLRLGKHFGFFFLDVVFDVSH